MTLQDLVVSLPNCLILCPSDIKSPETIRARVVLQERDVKRAYEQEFSGFKSFAIFRRRSRHDGVKDQTQSSTFVVSHDHFDVTWAMFFFGVVVINRANKCRCDWRIGQIHVSPAVAKTRAEQSDLPLTLRYEKSTIFGCAWSPLVFLSHGKYSLSSNTISNGPAGPLASTGLNVITCCGYTGSPSAHQYVDAGNVRSSMMNVG